MNNNGVDMFFMSEGSNYLESLIKSRYLLLDAKYKFSPTGDIHTTLLTKIDELIDLEIDLAIVGAKQAASEVKKATITPLKGV